MIHKNATNIIFLLPEVNQKPFERLNDILYSKLKKDYYLIELPYYRFLNNSNKYNFTFKVSHNNKTIFQKKNTHYKFTEFLTLISYFYFQIKNSLNFFKLNKKKMGQKVILVSQGLKNFLISYIFLILNKDKKIILVNFPGDIITEDYNFFGSNNILSKLQSLIFIKFQEFVKKISLKADIIIYENIKTYKYDKKKYNFFKKKIIFLESSLINYNKFKKINKNKKLYKNILYFGNFVEDKHFEKLAIIVKNLRINHNISCKIIAVGGDKKRIKSYHKKYSDIAEFHGYIYNFSKIETLVKKCSFGSALYNMNSKQKKIIPSGKINFYINQSIPVIASDNAYECKDINKFKIGFANNNIKKIENYLKINLNNKKKYTKILNNLEKFASKKKDVFHLTRLFNEIFKITNYK